MSLTRTILEKYQPADYFAQVAPVINANAMVASSLNAVRSDAGKLHFLQEEDETFDEGGFLGCTDTVTSLTDNPTEVTVDLQLYSTSTRICDIANLYDAVTDPVEQQVRKLFRQASRAMEFKVINGSGTGNEPKGLINWVSAGQTIDIAGAAIDFTVLDRLIDQVLAKSENMAFFMTPYHRRELLDAARTTAGGVGNLTTVQLANGQNGIAYQGYPILPSQFIHQAETGGTSSSVYFANLDPTEGFSMAFGPTRTQPNQLPGMGPFSVFNSGHMDTTPASNIWLQSAYNFMLRSPQGAARAKNVLGSN